jgi:glycosyltransferase involved in cell wall biosynthesis
MERTWDQEELIRLYTAADVFYNPSIEETFGLVTAEALACGTPAVVMNSTACPEPLQGCGITLQTHDPEEAIDAIGKLLTQEKPSPQQNFPCDAMTAGYLSIFRA